MNFTSCMFMGCRHIFLHQSIARTWIFEDHKKHHHRHHVKYFCNLISILDGTEKQHNFIVLVWRDWCSGMIEHEEESLLYLVRTSCVKWWQDKTSSLSMPSSPTVVFLWLALRSPSEPLAAECFGLEPPPLHHCQKSGEERSDWRRNEEKGSDVSSHFKILSALWKKNRKKSVQQTIADWRYWKNLVLNYFFNNIYWQIMHVFFYAYIFNYFKIKCTNTKYMQAVSAQEVERWSTSEGRGSFPDPWSLHVKIAPDAVFSVYECVNVWMLTCVTLWLVFKVRTPPHKNCPFTMSQLQCMTNALALSFTAVWYEKKNKKKIMEVLHFICQYDKVWSNELVFHLPY